MYKFGSVNFLHMIHPQKLQSLQEKVQTLKKGPKLEAFTVFLLEQPQSQLELGV
jgi:hypothetical protein